MVLLGIKNKGKEALNITSMGGMLFSPFDPKFAVQNVRCSLNCMLEAGTVCALCGFVFMRVYVGGRVAVFASRVWCHFGCGQRKYV